MRKSKQFNFAGTGFDRPQDRFGGSLLKNSHAKTSRPLDSKLPIHLVLRTQKSVLRLFNTLILVDETVSRVCRKHGVRIYKYANVGNHLHLVIKIPQRRRWAAFIRELSGRLAQLVRERLHLDGDFWTQRPFTRIVRGWTKPFQLVKEYVYLNWLEAEGHIKRGQMRTLKDLHEFLSG